MVSGAEVARPEDGAEEETTKAGPGMIDKRCVRLAYNLDQTSSCTEVFGPLAVLTLCFQVGFRKR